MIIKHELHQYKRVELKDSTVYRCMFPGCSHYVRKVFIINRLALCPYCGKKYMITPEISRLTTLHCNDCTKSRKVKVGEVADFLVELGNDNE